MPEMKTCPVCGVKILTGVIGGDRVMFSAGPPGDRAKLWARVCQYNKKPGCLNPDGGGQKIQTSDYYKPLAPPE
ncbi:MAG: hypothetical protein F6K04_12095 [Leptolyngbya sp. SIO4C5]|uniref:hypothetical protein n=1 Tax=Sphaerothrix gracilis TaxID=3151835 RepID=UPI0013BF15DC|nr:hypothetical protein [Leptolyngbya sp. SIO4C5]